MGLYRYCYNKYPVVVYDVISSENKDRLINNFGARYKNVWSCLDDDFWTLNLKFIELVKKYT
jgi:hypothetical protein